MMKSDINLLPKKKKKLSMSVSFGIPLGVILVALVVAIGIFLPKTVLNSQQKKLDALEQEIAAYSNTESDYTKKITELTTLQNQQTAYKDFSGSKQQTLDLLNKINAVKPATITLTDFTFDIESINLIGSATNDVEIARFEVALRKLAIFSEINLGTIKGPDNIRTFDINLMNKGVKAVTTGGTGK